MALDLDRLSPVEQAMSRRRRWLWIIILLVVAFLVWRLLFVNQYVVAYDEPIDHFLRGSIGSETANGLPILVFKALPVLYSDRMGPGGWRRFGLIYEGNDDLPVG